jgi:uncharacterized protein YgiM (DUF1202 family)
VAAEATEAAALATQAAARATLATGEDETPTPDTKPSEPKSSATEPSETPASPPTPPPTPLPPTIAPTPTPTPSLVTVIVTNPKLNVREGPDTVYKKIGQVKQGDELQAIGRNKEKTWIQIITPANETGWVAAKYTDVGDSIDELTIAQAPPRPKCRNGVRGLIAFQSNRGGIWVMNPNDSNQMPMCNPNAYYYALNNKQSYEYCAANGLYCVKDDWSPDRRNMDIYVLDNEYGSGWHRIVSNDHTDWGARIDPGGYWVVFVTNRNGNDELWMISRDVTGERRLTVNDWQWDKHPTWSPDGKRIAFFSNRITGRKQIWILDPNAPLKDEVNPRNISRNSYVDWDPVWLK